MSPLLSIAVPTHNRARYAVHAIRSLLSLSDTGIEVVVSDTSTDGELGRWVAESGASKDVRLVYLRPQQKLDMTGNHNAALAACRGDYVCLIGDDDTVTAEAVEAAAWARERQIGVIAPNVMANYVWPDFRSRYFGAGHASRLYIARRLGAGRIVDATQALEGALANAAQGTDGLPKIYHGIVARPLLEQLRERAGQYFHGSSPDVSGAVGLAMCCERFLTVDYPLTIPGASGGSNTGRSAMNTHKGALGQESQTRAFEVQGWSAGVPRFFSVETVWAHAALETLGRIDRGLLGRFNFARLLAACLELHPEFGAEIERAREEAGVIKGQSIAAMAGCITQERWRYRRARWRHLIGRALRPTAAGGRLYVGGLQTVADAPAALAHRMAQRQMTWEATAAQLAWASKA